MYIPKNILITFAYFGFIGYLNAFVTLNMIDPMRNNASLPDYGHDLLPLIPFTITNHLLIGYIIYFIIWNGLFGKINNINKFLWCMSLIFTIRLFTYSITIEPPPLPKCYSRLDGQPFVWNVLKYLYDDADNTCLDMMFSGHASYFTLVCLYIVRNSKYSIERMVNIVMLLVGIFCIIASHIHYTADVIVGVILTVLMHELID